MQEQKDTKLIFKSICDVMESIEAIGKNQTNKFQDFKFRGIDDVYNSLHDILSKHKVFTVPTVISEEFKEELTRKGEKCVRAILKIKYTLYAIDGSYIEGIVVGEALDSGDKAANKAMSIAHKYFLTQTFIIPTQEKDADAYSFKLASKKESNEDTRNGFIEFINASESFEELKGVFARAWQYAKETCDDKFAVAIKEAYEIKKAAFVTETK